MTEFDRTTLWIIIIALGLGSFGLRFIFLGLLGDRPLPAWLLRHLRYTGVSILPALIAPLILWPPATGGETDPARLLAAGAAVLTGLITRNIVVAITTGSVVLYSALAFFSA